MVVGNSCEGPTSRRMLNETFFVARRRLPHDTQRPRPGKNTVVRRLFDLVLLLSLLVPAMARAQLLVYPRRPSQTSVRYADFDWRYVDLLRNEKLKLDIEWQRGPRFH